MTVPTFTDKVTVIPADWANSVTALVYTVFNQATTVSGARVALGLGTLALQNANAVAITGGSITGTPIGAINPSTAQFIEASVTQLTPVLPGQLTSKQYVDTSIANALTEIVLSGITANLLATKLNISGGVMTGALILSGDPVAPLGAATKQYVDNLVGVGGGAATKQYVDNAVANAITTANTFTTNSINTLKAQLASQTAPGGASLVGFIGQNGQTTTLSQLANSTNGQLGAALIGYNGTNVAAALNASAAVVANLGNNTNPALGAGLVGFIGANGVSTFVASLGNNLNLTFGASLVGFIGANGANTNLGQLAAMTGSNQGASLIGYNGAPLSATLNALNPLTQAQTPNIVYAGPASGASAVAQFRPLVLADLPFAGQNNGVATLDANGYVTISQIPPSIAGGVIYKGTWNAATNTPMLASGTGTQGWLYLVSVSGTTNLDGINSWTQGDSALFNGSTWQKLAGNSGAVTSVAGRTGNVVLTYSDIGGLATVAHTGSFADLTNVPKATAVSLGLVQVGANLAIDGNGVLSATSQPLTPATSTVLGGVKIPAGGGLAVDGSGNLTAAIPSINSLTGALTIAAGSNITVTSSGTTITIASTGSGGLNSVAVYEFTATDGQTSFPVSAAAGSIYEVYVNGWLQQSSDYTIGGGGTGPVVLNTGVSAGTAVKIVTFQSYTLANTVPATGGVYTGLVSGVTPPLGDNSTNFATTAFVTAAITSYRRVVGVAATAANQTSFTIPGGYTVGSANMFMLGLYLTPGVDMNATDGSTVTIISSKLISNIKIGTVLTVENLTALPVTDAVASSALGSATGATLVGYGSSTVKATLDSLSQSFANARTVTVVTATSAGQTVFPIPGGYLPNLFDAYLIGAHLVNGVDYSATDGVNIVLSADAAASVVPGVSLVVNGYGTFNVANAAQLSVLGASGGASLIGWDGGTLSQFIGNSLSKQVPTFSQVAALDVTKYSACFSQGYAAPGDSGHAAWVYNPALPHSSANGYNIVASANGSGCMVMLTSSPISATAFGVAGTGLVDDTAALNAAASLGVVYVTGTPLVNGTVTGSFVMGPGAYFKLGASGSVVFTGLRDTTSKVFDLTLGGTVDLTRLEFTRPEWGGATGTGTSHDDTNGFLWTVQSNTTMRLRRGVTYGVVSKMSFSNVQNFTLEANGAMVLFTGPAPTAAGQSTVFTFKSATTFGQCAHIAVYDLVFDFLNAPSVVTQRVDNNFAIYFSMVDGITVERCSVLSSWSACFWIVYSNNTSFRRNVIRARPGAAICADGITHQSCGYNIVVENNIVENNGDDGIAVTWFAGNFPSTVGLTDNVLASRNVSIKNNSVGGQQISGRGIFLGGIFGGEITNNTVRNTSAYGIMLSRNTIDQYMGALTPTFVIGNGGTGYAVNDLIEFGGGFSPMVVQVTAVTSGAVTSMVVLEPGVYGTVPTGAISQSATSGSGTGLTATFTWLTNPFYNANGVNGANRSLLISGNTLEGCSLNSNDPNAGVGGMIVSESNFNITVENNTILDASNVGILCSGNATIRNNTIKGTTLQANGTVTAAQMPYKGTAIVTGDFNATYSNYGRIEGNLLERGAGRAIWIQQGSTLDPWLVNGNMSKNHGLPQNVSVDNKLTLISPYVSDTAYGAQWIDNSIRENRSNVKMPIGLCIIASAAVKERGTLLDVQTAAPGFGVPFDMATRLQLSASTAGFVVGSTVTGSSSGATALVAAYTPLADGTHDSVVLYQIVGTFTTSDTLLDSGSVAQTVTNVASSQGNGFIFIQQPAVVVQAGTTPTQLNISVLGAGYGKAYVVQQPPGGPAVSITADRNSATNIRVFISNPSAGVVTIPAGLWIIREV